MTKDELDAIRARVEADPKVGEACFDSEGNIGTVIRESDRRTLLAEVERLTAERDEAKAKVHEAFGDAFSAMSEKLRYSSDAYIERITKAAFARGVAAMREAAATHVAFGAHPSSLCGRVVCDLANEIRDLPDPEDK